MTPKIPWKESLVILLLLWLNAGLAYVSLRPKYIDLVSRSRWFRFFLMFLFAVVYFFTVAEDYRTDIVISVSILVAFIFDIFFSADAVTLETDKSGYFLPAK
jgi:K+-sensing histidine kinase KdpD